jgi:hypothetical protein
MTTKLDEVFNNILFASSLFYMKSFIHRIS